MNINIRRQPRCISNFKQQGVVLFLALIALLVMSLAAVALIRSVDTNSVIAGNLAFKQAATASADAGVEAAVAWLKANSSGGILNDSKDTFGYNANYTNLPVDNPKGIAEYWNAYAATGTCHLPVNGGVCSSSSDAIDAAGNRVDFIIHRMCRNTGGRNDGADCTSARGGGESIGNSDEPITSFDSPGAIYYRVLVRVLGPRDTVSYVQAMVVI